MTDENAPPQPTTPSPSGLPYALGAYTLWGFLPLYLVLLNAIDPFAVVGWRTLWTIPVCLIALSLAGRMGELKTALATVQQLKEKLDFVLILKMQKLG